VLAPSSFDYAVIRVVPQVEREAFLNVGVILFCRTRRYLAAQVTLNPARLQALVPGVDVEAAQAHLQLIPKICTGEGPIGALPLADRFHWLTAPRSTIIQVSPVHCGLCTDPAAALEKLMAAMVD